MCTINDVIVLIIYYTSVHRGCSARESQWPFSTAVATAEHIASVYPFILQLCWQSTEYFTCLRTILHLFRQSHGVGDAIVHTRGLDGWAGRRAPPRPPRPRAPPPSPALCCLKTLRFVVRAISQRLRMYDNGTDASPCGSTVVCRSTRGLLLCPTYLLAVYRAHNGTLKRVFVLFVPSTRYLRTCAHIYSCSVCAMQLLIGRRLFENPPAERNSPSISKSPHEPLFGCQRGKISELN